MLRVLEDLSCAAHWDSSMAGALWRQQCYWGLGRGCFAGDDSLLSEMRGSFCWEMGDWKGGQLSLAVF